MTLVSPAGGFVAGANIAGEFPSGPLVTNRWGQGVKTYALSIEL